MQAILTLKDVWLELGILLLIALYFIGGYLRLWEIKISKIDRQQACSGDQSTKVQPDGSVNCLPYGVGTGPSVPIRNHFDFD